VADEAIRRYLASRPVPDAVEQCRICRVHANEEEKQRIIAEHYASLPPGDKGLRDAYQQAYDSVRPGPNIGWVMEWEKVAAGIAAALDLRRERVAGEWRGKSLWTELKESYGPDNARRITDAFTGAGWLSPDEAETLRAELADGIALAYNLLPEKERTEPCKVTLDEQLGVVTDTLKSITAARDRWKAFAEACWAAIAEFAKNVKKQ
jgi:hypothetical protein